MNKRILVALGLVLAIAIGVAAYNKPQSPQQSKLQSNATKQNETSAGTPDKQPQSKGRYSNYSSSTLSAKGFSETILFFHAPWCPECRVYDSVIQGASLPIGTQILKVDYDTSTDLKNRYGVTLQTTFVKVTSKGEKVSMWSAYGKEKSLQAVLENT